MVGQGGGNICGLADIEYALVGLLKDREANVLSLVNASKFVTGTSQIKTTLTPFGTDGSITTVTSTQSVLQYKFNLSDPGNLAQFNFAIQQMTITNNFTGAITSAFSSSLMTVISKIS